MSLSTRTTPWAVYTRQWLRRWRLAEMRLLFLALLISAIAVSSVGFFTNRVDQAMQRQASQVLGGDLVLTSARPLAEAYSQQAEQLGLTVARTVSFRSMVLAGDYLRLAQVKAVSANYPLQGQLEGAQQLGTVGTVLTQPPLAGEVWAEPRLFNELQLTPDATVQLGERNFTLSRVLTKDPAQGSNPFQLAPSVLMALDDLEGTGLLTPASRAEYSLLVAGSPRAIQQLRATLAPQLQPTERIRTLDEGVPAVQQALQRAGRFLGLAALLSVVLAGAAIALSAGSLMRHETRTVAVLKAFGLSRRRIVLDYVSNLLMLAVVTGVLGAVLGYGLQWLLAQWLTKQVAIQLPAPTLLPAVVAVLTTLVMVTGFALPYLLNLVNQAPIAILQDNAAVGRPAVGLIALGVLPAIFVLLWLQAGELRLAIWLFVGLLAAIAVFWSVSQLALRALLRLAQRPHWQWLTVLRQSRRSGLLIVVFALGLFSLLLLTALRMDLVDRWQASLPADAPNYFLINIQPNEVEPLQAFLQQQQLNASLYPMIRGRLVAVNGKPTRVEAYTDGRAQRLLEREFNLSSFADLPSSNKVTAGQWFDGKTPTGFSIEEGIGETLGFGLGDTLTFDIAGQPFTDTVTSVRSVKWDSLQPNFFVIAAPGALVDKPQTFITSVYVPTQKTALMADLVRQFPAVTAIDTSAIAAQVKSLIDQATFAVQGIFSFTLVTGIVVLLAALQSQKAERRREIAILKSLGASRPVLRQRILVEFLVLGGLAGLLASVFTLLLSNALGYYLFDLGLSLNPWILGLGVIGGAVLVGVSAYANLRGLLEVTPMALLKA